MNLTTILEGIFEVSGHGMSRVSEVRFSSNLMDDTILKNFLPSLYPHICLKTLELSYNEIGDEALEEIAKLLPETFNLEEIILNNNKIGNTGNKRHLELFLQAFLLDLRNP